MRQTEVMQDIERGDGLRLEVTMVAYAEIVVLFMK
ncbi:hypothetical protein WG8_4672 [Paenibacillus sp. Aloe-11]|nr:hypothetical protein WG8_4672 [Paenibacillus sp. Aloe-11]